MKTVLLIITGGIAAYKSLLLIRELRRANYRVLPVMTQSAHQFVTPLSVAALAENPVRNGLFDLDAEAKMGHIELSREADLVVVAPASADFLAKITHGLADDLASTLVLANRAKLMVAPAMNVAMWESPATQSNMERLQKRGVQIVPPTEGDMACGEFGFGRLAEPEDIFQAIVNAFEPGALSGKKFIVTSGPTYEPIDPVRFIGNHSSGKQGTAIATSLLAAGAQVDFITGPTAIAAPAGANVLRVQTAEDMRQAVFENLPADGFIAAAAVADWRVKNRADEKLKKVANGLPALEFTENPDILAEVAASKSRPSLVIGFAAETENVIEHAIAKRKRKGCDWILANDVSAETGVFGGDQSQIHLITNDAQTSWPVQNKTQTAQQLVDHIIEHFETQT